MGGKGGGPLASWIREFTTLVFVQTVQAFIYALILIVILQAMNPSGSESGDDFNTGVGLMSVFALTSLFKVEGIIRKIFGLGDTKAGHKGAIKSIAKTAFALKLGKRVLDNGKKISGGIKSIRDYKKDAKSVSDRVRRQTEALNADNRWSYPY